MSVTKHHWQYYPNFSLSLSLSLSIYLSIYLSAEFYLCRLLLFNLKVATFYSYNYFYDFHYNYCISINSLSFLLRCGTRPNEWGTQWDSNSLVIIIVLVVINHSVLPLIKTCKIDTFSRITIILSIVLFLYIMVAFHLNSFRHREVFSFISSCYESCDPDTLFTQGNHETETTVVNVIVFVPKPI